MSDKEMFPQETALHERPLKKFPLANPASWTILKLGIDPEPS